MLFKDLHRLSFLKGWKSILRAWERAPITGVWMGALPGSS